MINKFYLLVHRLISPKPLISIPLSLINDFQLLFDLVTMGVLCLSA